MESDSFNAILWVIHEREIKALTYNFPVVFCHRVRSANGLVDTLAKQGLLKFLLGSCISSFLVL